MVLHLRSVQEKTHAVSCNPQNRWMVCDEYPEKIEMPKLCYSHHCSHRHRRTMSSTDFAAYTNYCKTQFSLDPSRRESADVRILYWICSYLHLCYVLWVQWSQTLSVESWYLGRAKFASWTSIAGSFFSSLTSFLLAVYEVEYLLILLLHLARPLQYLSSMKFLLIIFLI